MDDKEKEELNNNQEELEFNKKNREDYENLMEEASSNKDMYWDKNNPVVKLLLAIIGIVILVGVAYYVVKYLNH